MPASVCLSFSDFQESSSESILGHLTSGSVQEGFSAITRKQARAWQQTVEVLYACVAQIIDANTDSKKWAILLEYPVPRRAKYVDVIVIAESLVFVLEFKTGETRFIPADIRQVEDYCLDLRDFHEQSQQRILVPFLVATGAESGKPHPSDADDQVKAVRLSNVASLAEEMISAHRSFSGFTSRIIDVDEWNYSDYRPTPTIIEAAQTLFAGQSVEAISRHEAGVVNLTRTTEAVIEAIQSAKKLRRTCLPPPGLAGGAGRRAGVNCTARGLARADVICR